MNRIDHVIAQAKINQKKLLVPYVVAGDPKPEITLAMLNGLVDAGADIIELGIPFSDPMAEGPVIQRAHERALASNYSLQQTLEAVSSFRQNNKNTPIVLMGYMNPVERMTYKGFAEQASMAGIDGVLTVDLPPEEAEDLTEILRSYEISSIFLLSPTTKPERIQAVAKYASGYLYYVSLKGVTGASHLNVEDVSQRLEEIRSITSLPLCVGFGIKTPADAKAIGNLAEGVIVGSALVNRVEEKADQSVETVVSHTVQLVNDMRIALDEL